MCGRLKELSSIRNAFIKMCLAFKKIQINNSLAFVQMKSVTSSLRIFCQAQNFQRNVYKFCTGTFFITQYAYVCI